MRNKVARQVYAISKEAASDRVTYSADAPASIKPVREFALGRTV
jgi:hypothetical protein